MRAVALSLLFIVCIFGALACSAVLLIVQATQRSRQHFKDERAAKARRLRWVADDSEVVLGLPTDDASFAFNFASNMPSSVSSNKCASEATFIRRFCNVRKLSGNALGGLSKKQLRTCCSSSGQPSTTLSFHIFLSHVWAHGQDQMRIIKQRLIEMMPDVRVFLDVDDLKDISELEHYVDSSKAVLVFCTKGYFRSKNCMRELRRATAAQKPLIMVLDLDSAAGALSYPQVKEELLKADASYEKWGFGQQPPMGEDCWTALTAASPIEWNRLGAFQASIYT